MSRIIKRCPRCKKQTHVLAVYSRSIPKSPVMIPIENEYQCTVCSLVFRIPAQPTAPAECPDIPEPEVELLPDEAEIMERMDANEGKVE